MIDITLYFQETLLSFNVKLSMKQYSTLIKNAMGLEFLSSNPSSATCFLCDLGQVMYLTLPSCFHLQNRKNSKYLICTYLPIRELDNPSFKCFMYKSLNLKHKFYVSITSCSYFNSSSTHPLSDTALHQRNGKTSLDKNNLTFFLQLRET